MTLASTGLRAVGIRLQVLTLFVSSVNTADSDAKHEHSAFKYIHSSSGFPLACLQFSVHQPGSAKTP